MFPSPPEVDRFISDKILAILNQKGGFPSPLEVDRFICDFKNQNGERERFPSPLEVNRFISTMPSNDLGSNKNVSVPSRVRRFKSKC